ncbi:MAG: porin [Micropepsaceae bacterium]
MNTAKLASLASVVAIASASATAAYADNAKIIERIDQMQKQLENQQQQIEAQKQEIERLRSRLGGEPRTEGGAPASKSELDSLKEQIASDAAKAKANPSVVISNIRPTIQSADGKFSMSLRGRAQVDVAEHIQDNAGPLASDFRRGSQGSGGREVNSAREFSDGANFRRAQIGMEGKAWGDFNYKLVYEFGGSGTEGPARLHEAWVSYAGFGPLVIQAGALAPNANLDDGVASDETMFIERASPAELSRALAGGDGRYAIGIKGSGSVWFASAFLTGGTAGDAETADEQTAVVTRVASRLIEDEDVDLHVGANLSWLLEPADLGSLSTSARYGVRFRDRPELRVDSTRLIDTGNIDANSAYAGGLEAAIRVSSLFFQGEYFNYGVDRHASTGLANPDFSGWYAEAAWALTGESRKYNSSAAAFAAIKPSSPVESGSGFGAFELAARFSHVDLNFHDGIAGAAAAADSIRGGEQDIWTLGLNWYLNPNLRATLNYFMVDVNRFNPAGVGNLTPFGASPSTPPDGVQIGQDYDAVALRLQLAF